jgi:hypothetical protein
MTTAKIAITVPKEELEKARKAVRRGFAPSVSAYISRAMQRQGMEDDLDALLTELLEKSGGPMTTDEIEETDRIFGFKPKPKPKPKPKSSRRR